MTIEAGIYNRIRDVYGGLDLHDVSCPAWGSRYIFIIKMTPHLDGEAKGAMMAALSSPYIHPKIAIAVDEDVNIHDARDVMWAISTHVNPETDITVIPGMRTNPLDLSCPELAPPGSGAWQRLGGKMMIDATKPATWRPEREQFRRAKPQGWGARLADFVEPPTDAAVNPRVGRE